MSKNESRVEVSAKGNYPAASCLFLICTFVLYAVMPSAVHAAPGDIVTIAGGGSGGLGDDGLATSATLSYPTSVAVDTSGNVYIADYANNRIRKVDHNSRIITTVAGNGTAGYSGDSEPATSASLHSPLGVSVDTSGNIYIADTNNHRIRKVDSYGTITTLAGNGTGTFAGDGGPAISASLNLPIGVSVDDSGNIYVADFANNRIREVYSSGTITTIAGNGVGTYAGDNGPATSASLYLPTGVSVDASGEIYIADRGNNRIRMVGLSGTISTLAGNGTPTFVGDGGPATSAGLVLPYGVSVDTSGNVYIADTGNNRIRMVDLSGTISTLAGNGTPTFAGDGLPAISASLNLPSGVSVDASGNIYIADYANHRIRKLLALAPSINVTDSIAPISDLQMNFGNVTQGVISDQTVTVTNNGSANLNIGTITHPAVPFSIITDNCTGQAIAPASTCALTVRFAPTTLETFNSSFDIPSNDLTTPTVTLSVSGTANNAPPTAPILVFPADGQTGLGTTISFRWKKSTDPDGDIVTYHLYTCTDQNVISCTPVTVLSRANKLYLAGLGMYGGLMMIGMVFAGSRKGRKGLLLLTVIVLLTAGITLASCSGGGGDSTPSPPDPNEISYEVSNLTSGTTYYWKVVADDAKGGTTPSVVWSFSTQ